MSYRSSQALLLGPFPQIGLAVAAFLSAEATDSEVPARATSLMFENKLRVSKIESQNPIVSESQNQSESNGKSKSQRQSLSQKQSQSLSQC